MAASDPFGTEAASGSTAHLALIGDVDALAVPALRAQCLALLDRNTDTDGSSEVTLQLDCSAVRSIDSSGLGMLVWLRGSCLDLGATLLLVAVPPPVRRLFTTVGLEPFFEFADGPPADEAGTAAAAGPPTGPTTARPAAPELPVAHDRGPELAQGVAQDAAFDRMALLVRRVLDVPVVTVALVDEQSHTLPGLAGLTGVAARTREVPLSHSFCSNVVRAGHPLVLADARTDPVFALHPAVADQLFVAYAGMPLLDIDGRIVGTLCATDSSPREWTSTEIETLADIAAACSAELQLRGAIGRAAVSSDRERIARHLHETVTGDLLQLSLKIGSARSLCQGRAADLLDESLGEIDTVLRGIRRTLYRAIG